MSGGTRKGKPDQKGEGKGVGRLDRADRREMKWKEGEGQQVPYQAGLA